MFLTTLLAATIAQLSAPSPFTNVLVGRGETGENIFAVFAEVAGGAVAPSTVDVNFTDGKGKVLASFKSLPVNALPGSSWVYATPPSLIDSKSHGLVLVATEVSVVTRVAATPGLILQSMRPLAMFGTSGPCPNCMVTYLCGCIPQLYGVVMHTDYCTALPPSTACRAL